MRALKFRRFGSFRRENAAMKIRATITGAMI
jgi:hypothetical protein